MYTVPFYLWTLVSRLYLPADKSYYKNNVHFRHAITFSTSRGQIESCERCRLSPSIDGHWSHICIFLLTKVITNRKLILDMQFLFLPVEVKWKVVNDVHCPLLLIDTGLKSIFLLTNVITNRMLILDVQFPFLPVGVKLKVVIDLDCPFLLMDTGLTSLSYYN